MSRHGDAIAGSLSWTLNYLRRTLDWFRSIQATTVFLSSLVISTAVVATAIPLRWQGERTSTDAYIPLRPLTPAEAAALLVQSASSDKWRGGHTAIVTLDDSTAVVATAVYLLAREDPPSTECGMTEAVVVGSVSYKVCAASWESYCTLHSVDRRALEHELRRSLSSSEVQPSFLSKHPVSFSSRRLPFYAFVEIVFLTLLQSAAFFVLRRVSRPTAVLPILFLFTAIPFLVVGLYSPAFKDADWFHQRIIVESISLYGVLAAVVLALPAAVSLLLLVSMSATDLLAKVRHASPRDYRRRLLAGMGVFALILLGWQCVRYERTASRCVLALDAVQGRLTPALVSTAIHDPALGVKTVNFFRSAPLDAPGMTAIQTVLRSEAGDARHVIRVLIPLGNEYYLFLWRTDAFSYADIRELQSGHSAIIDYAMIAKILADGESHQDGPLQFLKRKHVCGRSAVVGPYHAILMATSP